MLSHKYYICKNDKEEEEESNTNKNFKKDNNNTNDKHKANECGGDLHSVSMHLELILFEANQSATKITRNSQEVPNSQIVSINNKLKRE